MIGIAEMFAELDGTQRYEHALAVWAVQRAEVIRLRRGEPDKRREATERTRAWRKANPERALKLSRDAHKRWKAKSPEKYRAWNKRAKARRRARYPEKVRAANTRNQRERRARIRAQTAAQAGAVS